VTNKVIIIFILFGLPAATGFMLVLQGKVRKEPSDVKTSFDKKKQTIR
jgi:hypothetical protein